MTATQLAFAAACALVLPALVWRDGARRGYAWLFVALLALYLLLPALAGPLRPPVPLPDGGWTAVPWLRQWVTLALLAVACFWAIRKLGFSRQELGLALAQRPGSFVPCLVATVVLLVCNFIAMRSSSFRLPPVPTEVWLYQATLPGLVEEIAFRGLLLALADRALPPERSVAGAPLGVGALVVTLVFWALHGVSLGTALGVLPAALLYVWLRARSGSLVWPLLAHNLWNLSVLAAHL